MVPAIPDMQWNCFVSTDYIRAVYFENHRDRNKYLDLIPIDISARVNSKVFCPRNDWQAWRN